MLPLGGMVFYEMSMNSELKGRLATFIESFLADRWIQVRVGSTLSEKFYQALGVLQGSILSTILFNIKINSIKDCLDPKTDGSLYVDDLCMCYRSKSMRTIERHLQQCINRIEKWASHNGFKFSKSKTQCVHFCQLRKVNDDPELYLYGSLIPVVEYFKFLGDLFDRKLSFLTHIKYLKAKCLKALNLLKVLSHTDRGADRTVFLQLNRSIICSKLDSIMNVTRITLVIFPDCLSVLQALNHTLSKNLQIQNIQNILLKHHNISEFKTIAYCWVPSYVGIYGNEQVDKKAKESLSLEQPDFKNPFCQFKPFINLNQSLNDQK